MITSDQLALGKAGEHFVCFDLLRQGYNAMLADQGQPFDIIIVQGKTFYTVQVKSSAKARKNRPSYEFKTDGLYDDIDLFAFVAIDILKVAYLTRDQIHPRVSFHDNIGRAGHVNEYRLEYAMRLLR